MTKTSTPNPWDNPGVPPTEAAQLAAAQAAQEQADTAAVLAASTVPPGSTPSVAPAADTPPGDGTPVETASEVTVTATVPKDFILNVTHDLRVHYKAGVQEMPLDHAEHWWAKANGVKVYKRN